MSTIKVNKNNMDLISSDLKTAVSEIKSDIDSLNSTLNSIPSHNDFPSLSSVSKKIASTLTNIQTDYNNLSENITTYVQGLTEIDSEGFDTSAEALANLNNANTSTNINTSTPQATTLEYKRSSPSNNYTYSYSTGPGGTKVNNNFQPNTNPGGTPLVYTTGIAGVVSPVVIGGMIKKIETEEGQVIEIPPGLGSQHTYMAWQMIKARSSDQYKLKESAGMNFDDEGFGKIGDRYVVATTTTFGKVGDFLDVYKEDGTVIKCIIGDIKNQNDANCNAYGHNNGNNIIEFVVDYNTWYNGHENPGSASCHPEWNQNITKIVNKGNYFNLLNEQEIVSL